uniref:Glycosyl transferase group 1 n=1 Tax=Rhodopseudomonas palustris (strain DX-1) TaxID=652103 RepID=E6VN05_RHOPX
MKLLTLFVRYGNVDYHGSFERLQDFYRGLPQLTYDAIIVDNALPPEFVSDVASNVKVIGGNNVRREFSGWDVAIDRFSSKLDECDLVHVVTSAFQNQYNGFYPLIDVQMLEFAASNDVVLGHVDSYPDSVRAFGRSFQTWACSKFLFVVPSRIRGLGSFVAPFDIDDVFSGVSSRPFLADAPLSENYRRHLLEWVTGEGLPHGKWHSSFALNDASLSRFISKATSILDEHILSLRLREADASIVDFTWLHAHQKTARGTVPDEICQVRERNVFLFNDPIIESNIEYTDYPTATSVDWLFSPSSGLNEPEGVFPRLRIFELILQGNRTLQAQMDMSRERDRAAMYLKFGLEISGPQKHWLQQVDCSVRQDSILPITQGLHALYHGRDDLRAAFDLQEGAGRRGLIEWWMTAGVVDPKLLMLVSSESCQAVDTSLAQDAVLPITTGLHALYQSRSDLRAAFDLDQRRGRSGLIAWWITNGISAPELAQLVPQDFYLAVDERVPQDAILPITKGLHALHQSRDDLRDAFDLQTAAGRSEFVNWWLTDGVSDPTLAKLGPSRGYPRAASVDGGDRERRRDEPTSSQSSLRAMSGSFRRLGVNIVGFGRGELGIGEDVRAASRALRRLDIDHCVPFVPLVLGARENDCSLRSFESTMPIYNVNLIFLPHYDTVRLVAETRNSILGGRYNIACWQWELPSAPKAMNSITRVVDEIWSSSNYTAESISAASDRPVRVMPMAVTLPKVIKSYRRCDFGLPDGDFVFLTIFDGNSSIYRKNPLATARAFLKAFPRPSTPVHLVVKMMNTAGSRSSELDVLLELCASDRRISVIDQTFERSRLIGLQSVCDCFVSLHRAEGFGRNIAEAMLLGRPVIVTNFSGNVDFTTDETAFLVGGNMVDVKPWEYAFSEGQRWCDPDIDEACEQMRACLEREHLTNQIAAAGRMMIESKYSLSTVARNYAERLNTLVRNSFRS